MSTKITISYDERHHVYQEPCDRENIWVSFDRAQSFEAVSDGQGNTTVTVAVPAEIWKMAVEGWNKMHKSEKDYSL